MPYMICSDSLFPAALRSTKLRTPGKNLVIIPNKTVAGEAIINNSRFTRRRNEQVFGLTHAEARLASALVQGLDLQEIARLHRVSVGTLRVQLKSVFGKTQTKRQAQLVALLAKLYL